MNLINPRRFLRTSWIVIFLTTIGILPIPSYALDSEWYKKEQTPWIVGPLNLCAVYVPSVLGSRGPRRTVVSVVGEMKYVELSSNEFGALTNPVIKETVNLSDKQLDDFKAQTAEITAQFPRWLEPLLIPLKVTPFSLTAEVVSIMKTVVEALRPSFNVPEDTEWNELKWALARGGKLRRIWLTEKTPDGRSYFSDLKVYSVQVGDEERNYLLCVSRDPVKVLDVTSPSQSPPKAPVNLGVK